MFAALPVSSACSVLALYLPLVPSSTCKTRPDSTVLQVSDVKVKLQAAFAPLKDTLRRNAGDARSSMELSEQPAAIQQLQTFGGTLRRSLN